jgi:hypothetical protein
MVNATQIKHGIARYVDSEILPKLPVGGLKRVALGTAASLYINGIDNVLENLTKNPFFSALGIVAEDGTYRIDRLAEALKGNIPDDGFKVSPRILGFSLGEMVFTRADIDALYRYINS